MARRAAEAHGIPYLTFLYGRLRLIQPRSAWNSPRIIALPLAARLAVADLSYSRRERETSIPTSKSPAARAYP